MPSTSTVFERLAHQGTAASKAREAEEKKLREEIEQRHAADAAIKALHVNVKIPQDAGSGSSQIKSPKLTPQQQAAFFDRLAKQETVSSAAHHHNMVTPPNNGAGSNDNGNATHKPSPRNHHLIGDNDDDAHQAVYNRLYKQETAASKAHHHHGVVNEFDTTKVMSPRPVASTPPPQPPSLLQRSTPNHPPIPISTNLYIRTHAQKQQQQHNHDHGGETIHTFSTLEIESNRVRKQINLHHSGKVSALSLTHDIITELFMIDFQPPTTTATAATATAAMHPTPSEEQLLDAPQADNTPLTTATTSTTTTTTVTTTTTTTTHGSMGHWEIGPAIVEELDGGPSILPSNMALENGKKQSPPPPQPSTTEETKWYWAEKEAIRDTHEIYSVAKAKAIIQICGGGGSNSIYVDEYQYTVVRREK